MDIYWMYAWLLLAVILIFIELGIGTLVFFSFGLSALVVSAFVGLFPDLNIAAQLGVYALSNIIIVPSIIHFLRPRFSPKASRYGLAGSGAQDGLSYITQRRNFDEATCVMIDNVLYRAQLEDGLAPELNSQVTLLRFESTVAIVKPCITQTNP